MERSADPNSKNDDNQSPLIWASKVGHEDTVRVLLDYGAHPNMEASFNDPNESFAVLR